MADDGILLNFELPSEALAPKQTFRGGTWKERLKAKRSSQPRQKRLPRFEEVGREDAELILPGDRPTKRVRLENDRNSSQHSVPKSKRKIGDDSKTANSGVVSSLFTYNPNPAPPEIGRGFDQDETVEPSNAPLQEELATFTNLGLTPTLAGHLLKKLDIKSPTAIQRKAIEQLCASPTDAFIQAETGSGKTLAYLLPLVQQVMQLSKSLKENSEDFSRESGLFAVILSPTRELSKQISTVLDSLLICCHWVVAGTVIGGEKKKSEKARLRKGLNILVATPGRLADHLDNTEVLDVSKVRWLVLDEGDRLMELGFEKDIQKIVSVLNLRSRKAVEISVPGLPERRTTVLCSATLKPGVEQLRNMTLKDAVSISTDEKDEITGTDGTSDGQPFSAPAQLRQSYVVVPAKQRLVTLVATLKQTFKRKGSVMKCIVFISCADSVDFHFEILTRSPAESEQAEETAIGRTGANAIALSHSDKIPQGNTISETRTQGLATSFGSKDNPVQLFRLHGSLQQSTRTGTLMAFSKSTDPAVLVCTDVASRGLDLPNVDLVIEYDPPFSGDDHLHRIGRTARAGKDGRAMIFLMPGCEEEYVSILKDGRPRNLTRHIASEMLKKGFSVTKVADSDKYWEDEATDWQLTVERWALERPKRLEQARRAFQSHIRAYATHVAAERAIFDMKQLHLGHLAKAFALRDKPGSIRVPGLRPSRDDNRKTSDARKTSAAKMFASKHKPRREDDDFEIQAVNDEADARKRMQSKMKALSGASEFNLG